MGQFNFRGVSTGQPLWISILRSAVLILFGLFAVIRPVQTIVFLAKIVGVYFLIDGIFIVARSLQDRGQGGGNGTLIRGIITAVIGAIVLFIPACTVATVGIFFMYILGTLSLVHGIFELVKASRSSGSGNRDLFSMLGGIFFILLAVLLFFRPSKSRRSDHQDCWNRFHTHRRICTRLGPDQPGKQKLLEEANRGKS
jgi:uncharacterized membrane protein HdeD (DUF308 family)